MFAKDGYFSIGLTITITVMVFLLTFLFVRFWVAYIIYAVFAILCGLVIYFFRDPERITPEGSNLIISPADGKVVLIKDVFEEVYLNEKATQISIFLSVLDVHVNRNPVSGYLEYVKYHLDK